MDEEEELPNLLLEESLEGLKRLLLPELKLLGLGLKFLLGAAVVVVVVAVLKLNLDLVLGMVLDLGRDVGDEVDVLLFNLALDLDLVRSGVALVVGSGTSEMACLLKPALCLEEDWAGLLTELLES